MPISGARVPAKVFDTVTLNAQAVLNNIDKMADAPPIYGLKLPGAAMTPEGYYAWVKASPTWVTSPNEDSLLLKDPQDKLVRGKDGKPISVPFSPILMPEAIKATSEADGTKYIGIH
jgi:hypothetical protein